MQYRYRIRVRGYLDPSWADWFEGLAIHHSSDGQTDLIGVIADQPKLMNILARIHSLNLELVSMERQPGDPGEIGGKI